MERRNIILGILLLLNSTLCAQSLQLENSWKSDSKYLYVGTDNRLLVKGQIKLVNSVRCENASCRMLGDTIFVNPKMAGSLEIELCTDQQKISIHYIVKMLEPPAVAINTPNCHGATLSKADIDRASLIVSSWKPVNEELYENFVLDGFVIKVGGDKYYVKGIEFPVQVRAALHKLNSGDSFSVEEIYLTNKENGLPFRTVMSFRFTII